MPIDSPQAVRFCNERVRPAADRLAQAYAFATRVLNEWNAQGGTAVVPNSTDVVDDGADVDGRPIITGQKVNNVVNRVAELIADYEAGGQAKLNTILEVAVNTG